ncbi:hypothetical protein [Erythrobacter litoralis]|uniref:Uncharacterized protein n=1 Tax=Erythrobacter litoralis (strain HTCC2594) TaxID=314225 RepID=Q2N7Y0_ERYLH|nr:hypothetical protein [Erythrobacter litoralis]ABC64211.1 hypothetical protein ELI_10595 [Erythrobacter litoralis HTCC2594]
MESSSPPNILAIFEELDARVDKEGYTFASEEDVDRWAGQLDVDWLSCLDLIGAELAKKYHANEVSYEFGDSLANDLNSTLMFRHEQVPEGSWPSLFWEVHEAFDAGEWPPKTDELDPIEQYTKPEIARIVARLA